MHKKVIFVLLTLFLFLVGTPLISQEATSVVSDTSKIDQLLTGLDTLWVLIAGFLVFLMNLGFGMVEAGLARAKNTVNILTKNFIVFALASLGFWIIGFGLMFANGNAFMGLENIFFVTHGVEGAYDALSWANVPLWAKFFFQLAFAGTAATIVSGAIAERVKILAFIIFAFILVALLYPITGHWIWGGGWLAELGFFDFAGSTVVHSVGGWAALAGVIVLGPRLGKYRANGTIAPIPGHNLSMVTMGGLILWFGWFGFNPGSTMGIGDGSAIAHIAVTTNTGAVFAVLSATIVSWIFQKKPDLTMIINGALAGLVAITAGCAFVTVESAAIIGFIAGILVVFSVWFFDILKLDDPVGALSVHLINGIWGTLAVGLFAVNEITGTTTGNGLFIDGSLNLLGAQGIGILAVGAFTLSISLVVWFILKVTMGIRVSKEEENSGLDLGEHGIEAYPDFQGFLTK